MHIKLHWPQVADLPLRENFYVGGWHPHDALSVEWTLPPAGIEPLTIQARNWFLFSNASFRHSDESRLIHASRNSSGQYAEAVAFRGYVLVPPIHSYSSSHAILRYWLSKNRWKHEHNGVFSTVCLREAEAGSTLELITDAFGMGALYYRRLGEAILFATNSRFLTVAGDEPDYLAWRSLIQTGFITADRTLSAQITRVPVGSLVRFQSDKREICRWFDFTGLPEGRRRVNRKAIAEVEERFQQALSRCLRLRVEHTFLALSSGYDSRRILAGLLERKTTFEAATVQVFQKSHRDLDARFASDMAQDLGFPHALIGALNVDEYAYDDYQRRVLLDAESREHTWALSLMRFLSDGPTLFLDGLGGDVLGNAEFIVPGSVTHEFYQSSAADTRLLTRLVVNDDYNHVFQSECWPSAEDVRHELLDYLKQFPAAIHLTTISKLALRTRRTISPWAQQMLPTGHVVVCPFLDLDYVRTLLSFHPREKYETPLQKACLQTYWPQYYRYPGTKAVPPGMPPGSPLLSNKREVACFRRLHRELLGYDGMSQLTDLLSRKAKLRFWIALRNDRMALITMWAFRQLMEIVAREVGKTSCWEVVSERREGSKL